MLKHLNPDLKLICLAVYLLNEHRATSNDCTMYNTFLFLTVLNIYIYIKKMFYSLFVLLF